VKYSLVVTTEPVAEPVTLAQAAAQVKQEVGVDDTRLTALIKAARTWAENFCRRSFVRRTYELRMDCFPNEILLPRGPVSSVTSVEYINAGGTETTLSASDYQTDLYSIPARIVTEYATPWPVTKPGEVNAVIVTYVAGYPPGAGSPDTDVARDNVPEEVKQGVLMYVQALYDPEHFASYEKTAEALLAPFVIRDYRLE
jgi:uncharacterized phiE125 gp8 family phage protein